MTMRTSLAHLPSPMTDAELSTQRLDYERRLFRDMRHALVPLDDPAVPAVLRMAAEAWCVSRFGKVRGKNGR